MIILGYVLLFVDKIYSASILISILDRRIHVGPIMVRFSNGRELVFLLHRDNLLRESF